MYRSYGIQTCIKPTGSIRHTLVSPKDKSNKEDIAGVVYYIPCIDEKCSEFYIGETERRLKTRFQEHHRPSSVSTSEVAEHIHVESPGHTVDISGVKILEREHKNFDRGIKEAIYIRAYQPTLNRHAGRHQLSHVYDKTLSTHMRKLNIRD